jgi:hypothetical protein
MIEIEQQLARLGDAVDDALANDHTDRSTPNRSRWALLAAACVGVFAIGFVVVARNTASDPDQTSTPAPATTNAPSQPPKTPAVTSVVPEDAFATVFERFAGGASRTLPAYRNVADALPTVEYHADTGEVFRVSDAFVLGEYVKIEPGVSMRWDETTEEDIAIQLPFGDPTAMASTAHVTVEVTESVLVDGSAELNGQTITVGIVVWDTDNLATIKAEFEQHPTIATMLTNSSLVFDYDPTLWAIIGDGSFLGLPVGDQLIFPALPGIGLPANTSLDDLTTTGRQPRIVNVTEYSGGWVQQ